MAVRSHDRTGFTLIELLVLIAIFSLIAALAFTSINKARHSALRGDCQNRLRNQALAVFHYESREGHLPPGCISGPYAKYNVPEDVMHGLWAVLQAELDQPTLAGRYRWDVSYDDNGNRNVVNTVRPALLCPALDPTRVQTPAPTRLYGVADYAPLEVNPFLADIGAIDPSDNFDGPLPVNGAVRLVEIHDGLTNTILLAEAGGRPGMAWASSDLPVSVRFVLGGEAHQGGANVVMCDGSVRFLTRGMDMKLLARLTTRRGGEVIDAEW